MSRRKLTYEDLLRIPYDGMRHEIIDGVHYATDAHYTKEQRIIVHLKSLLRLALRTQFFYDWPGGDRVAMGKLNGAGARELVVEILPEGKSTFDRRASLAAKTRGGTLEYWLVIPALDLVEVFRRAGEGFARIDTGDTLTTPLLPGFALPLRELFA